MAWIGKNGKDGKEGKDDSGGQRLFEMDAARPQVPVRRSYFRVILGDIAQIPQDLRDKSNIYWQEVEAMGMADAHATTDDGNTVLMLSVLDEGEATSLVNSDPVVASGLVGSVNISSM